MKIAIITTPFLNYGSRLQNLASIELLKDQFPKAKVYTLIPSKTRNKIILFFKNSRIIQFLYLKMKFRGKINKNNKLLNYKAFFVKDFSIEELSPLNNQYDLFVVGSDQIWNFPKGEKSNFLFAMFTNKKICNAPSFAITKYTTVPEMRLLLSSFKDLNVRELETKNYINNELGIKCNYLADPTLRLPVNKWNRFVKKSKDNNYVMVYILEKEQMINSIIDDLKNKKLRFRILYNSNDERDTFKYTPLDFINLIAHSSIVITNSFHGACLAKIFKKKLKIYKNNRANDARFKIFETYDNLLEIV